MRFKSTLLLRVPHAIWALVWRRKRCDFLIPGWGLSDRSLSLTLLTCFSLSISKHIFYPIDWLAYTSSPCRHGKTSFESSVLSPCLSTSSCQPHQHQTRSAPDKVKLKHTLSLYIDKMSRLSRDKAPSKSSIQSALSRERITLKLEKRLKMKQLFFLPTLCLKEGKGEIILKWVVSV